MEAPRLSRPVVRGVNWVQNHQGPLNLGEHPGLGTTTARGPTSAAVSSSNDGSASIIAPGREGGQSGGACPDMVEGCSHDPGPRSGWGMVRVVGVVPHLGGPLSFGNRAPRRVRSQAIAQNHQGPPGLMGHAGLGTTTARGHISAAVSSGNDQSASILAPGREGSQSGAHRRTATLIPIA